MENKDGYPEKYHVVDLNVIDHVIGAGLFIGRVLGHLRWEPRMSSSEHYEPPTASDVALEGHDCDYLRTRMAQVQLNFDSEGTEVA